MSSVGKNLVILIGGGVMFIKNYSVVLWAKRSKPPALMTQVSLSETEEGIQL